nr:LacI family transcriptional regulator [Bacillota bacterium]
ASYTTPALTTIRQHTYEMGEAAAHLLIDMLEGVASSHRVVIDVELVQRDSVAPPRRHA